MANKDLHNNIEVVQLLNPVVIIAGAATVEPDVVFDTMGAESAEVIVNVGASGDTLASDLKLDFKLFHGDLADMSDAAAIDDASYVVADGNAVAYNTTSGVFATVDAAAEDDAAFKIGYVGPKQYLTVKTVKTGTHTVGTPVSITGVKGALHYRP